MPLTNLLIGLAVLAWLIRWGRPDPQAGNMADRDPVAGASGMPLVADPLITDSGGPMDLGGASLLLYLPITWWTQRFVTRARAEPLRG
jgi:hypothetical protein